MEKKELKKYNIVENIWKDLFGYHNKYNIESELNIDIGSHGLEIDLTKTSCNLDFKVSTYQSKSENIYFNVSLYDYETKETTNAGYFYIKNYHGEVSENDLKALFYIMQAGNKLTNDIFYAA